MISNILVIADASREASVLVLDALQKIQKHQPTVRAIFISYLSEFVKKYAGPNTLNHIMTEERQSLERIRHYFASMGIPYSFKVITISSWLTVLSEFENGDQDIVILQGEFLKLWKEKSPNLGLHSHVIDKSTCPILMIHGSEETSHFGL